MATSNQCWLAQYSRRRRRRRDRIVVVAVIMNWMRCWMSY